jgi:hypothetical protein
MHFDLHRGMLLVVFLLLADTLHGQGTVASQTTQSVTVALPTIAAPATGRSTRPITAAEASAHAQAKRIETFAKTVSYRNVRYPIDSMHTVIAATGVQWLSRLQPHPVEGIQLDPAGKLGVTALRAPYSETQIAKRLATPGLSRNDKAYTLRTAVESFTDVYAPERLPEAEAYCRALDALGDSVATSQFEAHKTLLWTYYLLGQGADVIRHGTRAIQLSGIMPFANRNLMFGQTMEQVYMPTVEALTGKPDGRASVQKLNAVMRAAAVPSAALLAFDSVYARLGEKAQAVAEHWIESSAKLGTHAAPLFAHRWLNRGTPDSTTVPVNDGTIRLIEIATTGCAGCMWELHAVQRLRDRYPEVEPIMMTWTSGSWGNRFVEPIQEVGYLTDFLVKEMGITVPIGIWAGKKIPNNDGGMTPEPPPMFDAYPVFGKPMLWVVDGQGIVRRIFNGYDREIEMQIARTVELLVREKSARKGVASVNGL